MGNILLWLSTHYLHYMYLEFLCHCVTAVLYEQMFCLRSNLVLSCHMTLLSLFDWSYKDYELKMALSTENAKGFYHFRSF